MSCDVIHYVLAKIKQESHFRISESQPNGDEWHNSNTQNICFKLRLPFQAFPAPGDTPVMDEEMKIGLAHVVDTVLLNNLPQNVFAICPITCFPVVWVEKIASMLFANARQCSGRYTLDHSERCRGFDIVASADDDEENVHVKELGCTEIDLTYFVKCTCLDSSSDSSLDSGGGFIPERIHRSSAIRKTSSDKRLVIRLIYKEEASPNASEDVDSNTEYPNISPLQHRPLANLTLVDASENPSIQNEPIHTSYMRHGTVEDSTIQSEPRSNSHIHNGYPNGSSRNGSRVTTPQENLDSQPNGVRLPLTNGITLDTPSQTGQYESHDTEQEEFLDSLDSDLLEVEQMLTRVQRRVPPSASPGDPYSASPTRLLNALNLVLDRRPEAMLEFERLTLPLEDSERRNGANGIRQNYYRRPENQHRFSDQERNRLLSEERSVQSQRSDFQSPDLANSDLDNLTNGVNGVYESSAVSNASRRVNGMNGTNGINGIHQNSPATYGGDSTISILSDYDSGTPNGIPRFSVLDDESFGTSLRSDASRPEGVQNSTLPFGIPESLPDFTTEDAEMADDES